MRPASSATAIEPDGLLDATQGLEPGSIELLAGARGDVFPSLLSFATAARTRPERTTGTLVFGGLPLADG